MCFRVELLGLAALVVASGCTVGFHAPKGSDRPADTGASADSGGPTIPAPPTGPGQPVPPSPTQPPAPPQAPVPANAGILHVLGTTLAPAGPESPSLQFSIVGGVRADGRIVVAATEPTGEGYYHSRLLLFSFGSDGRPDLSFGEAGSLRLQLGRSFRPTELLVDGPSGNIWVTGLGSDTAGPNVPVGRPVVLRLTPTGQLDSAFGDQGVLSFGFPGLDANHRASAVSAALDSSGRLLLAVVADDLQRSHLFRFHPDGRLDPSFATSALTELPLVGAQWVTGIKVRVQRSGGVLVAAAGRSESSPTTTRYRTQLVRLDEQGRFDVEFFVRAHTAGDWSGTPGFDFSEDEQGRILIQNEDGRIFRLLADGSADPASPVIPGVGTLSLLHAGEPGVFYQAGPRWGGVARRLADGRLDPSFGRGGRIADDSSCAFTLPDGHIECDIRSRWVGHDSQGRSVFVGSETLDATFTPTLRVSRYLADGTPDATFGGKRAFPLPAIRARALSGDAPPVAVPALARGNLDPRRGFAGVTGLSLVNSRILGGASGGSTYVAERADTDQPRNSVTIRRVVEAGPEDTSFAALHIRIGDQKVSGYESARALTFGPAGEILVASESQDAQVGNGAQPRIVALSLFSADGRPIPSFGQAGVVVVPTEADPYTYRYAERVSFDPSGRILLLSRACGRDGTLQFGRCGYAIHRFESTGRPDRHFGTRGAVSLIPAGELPAWSLEGTPQVFGPFPEAGGALRWVWKDSLGVRSTRLLDNGALDRAFGTNGSRWAMWKGAEDCLALDDARMDERARITVALACPRGIQLARVREDGLADPGFAAGGLLPTGLGLGRLPPECRRPLRSPARLSSPASGSLWVAALQLPEKVQCPVDGRPGPTSARLSVVGVTEEGGFDPTFAPSTQGRTDVELGYHFREPVDAQLAIGFLPGANVRIAVGNGNWLGRPCWLSFIP